MTAYPFHVNKDLPHQANEKPGSPSDNSFDVRSADNEFSSALDATTPKTKVDPVLDVTKGRIIVDNGSGVYIVGRSNVHKKRHSMIRADGQPLKLNTAKGQIDATSCVRIGSTNFKLPIEACVLDNSPNVPSVGKLCHEGWSLNWNGHQTPTLISPDGMMIH